MADKLKPTTKTKFDAGALKSAIASVNRKKEEASEANGEAGSLTKQYCEDNNYNKKAFTFVASLKKKELQQQQEVIAALVTYAHALGMFDQIDMFNNSIDAMRQIVADAEKGQSGKKPSATISSIVSGETSAAMN